VVARTSLVWRAFWGAESAAESDSWLPSEKANGRHVRHYLPQRALARRGLWVGAAFKAAACGSSGIQHYARQQRRPRPPGGLRWEHNLIVFSFLGRVPSLNFVNALAGARTDSEGGVWSAVDASCGPTDAGGGSLIEGESLWGRAWHKPATSSTRILNFES